VDSVRPNIHAPWRWEMHTVQRGTLACLAKSMACLDVLVCVRYWVSAARVGTVSTSQVGVPSDQAGEQRCDAG
jgi:hypothetical protein